MELSINDIVQYFLPLQQITSTPINNGLINKTFKIENEGTEAAFIVQQINTVIFTKPVLLQQNYRFIAAALQQSNSSFQLPAIVPLLRGGDFLAGGRHGSWRMFNYIKNSYAPAKVDTAEQAHAVALSFSRFTLDLAYADETKVHEVLPQFHNVTYRHQQLVLAIQQNKVGRLEAAKKITLALERYQPLLAFYQRMTASSKVFRQYIQHHDAKISNILFDEKSHQVITPIDLDTTMPGYYFSDAGDMFRSMATNTDENNMDFDHIAIRSHHYEAVTDGYLTNMGTIFTKEEQQYFHLSGLLLTYMQCLRFITDYLNGDVYYHTTHEQQNLHRAKNQLVLLQALEAFVKDNFHLSI